MHIHKCVAPRPVAKDRGYDLQRLLPLKTDVETFKTRGDERIRKRVLKQESTWDRQITSFSDGSDQKTH